MFAGILAAALNALGSGQIALERVDLPACQVGSANSACRRCRVPGAPTHFAFPDGQFIFYTAVKNSKNFA